MSVAHLKVLECSESSTIDDIKLSYRRLAKRVHPDVNKSPSASVQFRSLTDSYQYLLKYHSPREEEARPAPKTRPKGRDLNRVDVYLRTLAPYDSTVSLPYEESLPCDVRVVCSFTNSIGVFHVNLRRGFKIPSEIVLRRSANVAYETRVRIVSEFSGYCPIMTA